MQRTSERRLRWACAALVLMFALEAPARCRAQERLADFPLHMRLTLAAATMVSRDQLDWLGFDSVGLLGGLEIGYSLMRWLDLRLGVGGGGFPAEDRTGGLLAPQLGAAIGWPDDSIRPWLQLDVGLGLTGPLLRPLWRAGIGLDLRLTNALTLGPAVGYTQVFQSNGADDSTDARFFWFGLALGWNPVRRRVVTQHEQVVTRRVIVERRQLEAVEPAEPSGPPPASSAPSAELLALIETALPIQRNEWLAPVLFRFDSAELEPQGVAMLHEVARELARRPQLKLLEIHGYADSRGSAEYNLTLSARRANAVLEWLVRHGVARERLRVAAAGASAFVEQGEDEAHHEQNRRVVFRVIDPAP